ncbi:MAG: hypothetical protein CM15mP77_0210 [Synechococcus sp.]|nr:MAG: hypothetical protein CM15mP77_0210 [Synechococcus sp.]
MGVICIGVVPMGVVSIGVVAMGCSTPPLSAWGWWRWGEHDGGDHAGPMSMGLIQIRSTTNPRYLAYPSREEAEAQSKVLDVRGSSHG